MLKKTHIVTSELPLTAGIDTLAICGQVVRDARWIWNSEGGHGKTAKEIFNSLTICGKCWSRNWDGHYVYGMVAGGEN